MEYNIIGLDSDGQTKFLSKLFNNGVDEKDRKMALSFDKEEVDNIRSVVESENPDFYVVHYFPTHLPWKTRNNKIYHY